MTSGRTRARAGAVVVFLAITFLDELVDGVVSAAWPQIRTELGLDYIRVGMLLSLPGLASVAIEPLIGVMGDVGHRWRLLIAGGALYVASLALVATSPDFAVLLIGWLIFFPASGAFVSLAQASLMDFDLKRHAQNMARWNFIGSLGNLAGPALLTVAVAWTFGWRGAVWSCAAIAVVLLAFAVRLPARTVRPNPAHDASSFAQAAKTAIQALRRFDVARWQVLLQASDLMLDLFKSFVALYMVDVVGGSESSAALVLAAWIGAGLGGELMLIPLLERAPSLRVLRISVIAVLLVYPAFLLAPNLPAQLVLVGALGIATAGWYPILQSRAYSSLPERSGTIVAIGNVFGIAAAVMPLGLGLAAAAWGLRAAMWLLLVGPIVVGAGLSVRPPHTPGTQLLGSRSKGRM